MNRWNHTGVSARVPASRRSKRAPTSKRLRYKDYVASVLERKLATGTLATPSSRRGWIDTQHLHLLPAFGDCYLDAIKRIDIEERILEKGSRRYF